MAKFFVKKEIICKHCQQITLFEDCLVEVEHYRWFVCWGCLKKLYLSCEGCQRNFVKKSPLLKWLYDKSAKICTSCIDEGTYVYCNDCEKLYDKEKCEWHYSLDACICTSCLEENYSKCSFCNTYHHRRNVLTDSRDQIRCDSCADSLHQCGNCECFYPTDEGHLMGSENYCEACFSESFDYCNFCGEVFNRELLCVYNETSYCCTCGGDRNLPLVPYNGYFLQPYDYKPTLKFYSLKGDNDLYFGVELEVENVKDVCNNTQMIEKLIPVFGNFVYYKRDGSINNGFELVTHPFTWRWYKESRKMWEQGLGLLGKEGFQSYEPKTCGIHIHMSKKAFSDVHLFKFLKFFYENYNFVYKISQRDADSTKGACQWGKFREESDQKLLLSKTKAKQGFQRFTAINLESKDTYEVRIFRGTIKVSSFFKNIEFCRAMFEFSNITGISKIGVEEFTRFVGNERKVYSNLFEFMGEKEMF